MSEPNEFGSGITPHREGAPPNFEQCTSCFFVRVHPKWNQLHCHRYPPAVANPDDFVAVNPDWWCGEWRPK